MKRVLVIGSPGTGKTTFAKKLAEKTGLPLVHLDLHYHDKSKDYYNEINKEAWQDKVAELIKHDTWIIDGNYNSTLVERLTRADTIIFFDFPRHKAFEGVLNRRVKLRNKKRSDMPDDWKERLDWGFLRYIWKFNKVKRPMILEKILANKNKEVVIFKTRADAERYLRML
jgi:adenylate kinase family enzyme